MIGRRRAGGGVRTRARALGFGWALALGLAAGGCGSGCDLLGPRDCFDPDDPCPNDIVIDESGCGWDRCSGGFSGNLVPCWFLGYPDGVGPVRLAGDASQYLAYVESKKKEGVRTMGPIWLYHLETGEETLLTEADRLCFDLVTDGNRVAWTEQLADYGEEGPLAVRDVFVKDIVTRQEWRVPNPERRYSKSYSLSGDRLVLTESQKILCDALGLHPWNEIYVFDLSSGEKTLVDEPVLGEYTPYTPHISGDRIVYIRDTGACATESFEEVRFLDLATGAGYPLLRSKTMQVFFSDFDGRWFVYHTLGSLEAIDVDSLREVRVTECGHGDCVFELDDGLVLFDRYGEDGLVQYQLYLKEVDSPDRIKLTDLRPYFDYVVSSDFERGRMLWLESRGRTVHDECGNWRTTDGATSLVFWSDAADWSP